MGTVKCATILKTMSRRRAAGYQLVTDRAVAINAVATRDPTRVPMAPKYPVTLGINR
ncbi:hypothetical protein GWN63_05795 [Candidatus Bathyarchaeota archaeon]|nr:hypothetical protein [Candidatus Bathyarchaeota archaeon]NIV68372.1 hypothetical protein [Candidatus Bathyarchaeota archaeon]